MNKTSITWGTCWFNEDAINVIEFFKKSSRILKDNNFNVELILFDARFNHNYEDIKKIKEEIKDIKIILNKTNIFPNKNYGVAAIAKESKKINTDYIAIIDPDWCINDMDGFIKQLTKNLKNADVILPNIKGASGRSNMLIGNTAISIFFKEYKNIIKSPFPGAIVAKTEKLFEIVKDKKYNFDWGGEWDIIAIALEKQMNISSVDVDVIGVRHRTNKSKMNDSFQIWKAILSNEYVINKINKNYDNKEYNNLNIYRKLKDITDIKEMTKILENGKFSKTEKQFLYMILYPIAVFYNKIDSIPEVKEFIGIPYQKEELYNISNCIIGITNKIILKEYKNTNNIISNSTFYSKWNANNMREALETYEVV